MPDKKWTEMTEVDVAKALGTNIGEALLGGGKDLVFGVFLKSLGLGGVDHTAEILQKLDTIIDLVKTLTSKVDQLRVALAVASTELGYNQVVAPIKSQIDQNEYLWDQYRILCSPATAETKKTVRKEIKSFIELKVKSSLQSWHNALVGTPASVGVIAAWSRFVFESAKSPGAGWFGPAHAAKIQAHWDYLDAHQALTMAFLCDYYNSDGKKELAAHTLALWHGQRAEQVKKLRGMTRPTVSFAAVGADPTNPVSSATAEGEWPVNHLPANTAIQIGRNRMWWLGSEVFNVLDREEFFAAVGNCTQALHVETGRTAWGWPVASILTELLNDLGHSQVSHYGSVYTPYGDDLKKVGFVFDKNLRFQRPQLGIVLLASDKIPLIASQLGFSDPPDGEMFPMVRGDFDPSAAYPVGVPNGVEACLFVEDLDDAAAHLPNPLGWNRPAVTVNLQTFLGPQSPFGLLPGQPTLFWNMDLYDACMNGSWWADHSWVAKNVQDGYLLFCRGVEVGETDAYWYS